MPSEFKTSVTSSTLDQSELNTLYQLYPKEALKYIRENQGSPVQKKG